jgi:hypothetical protein
MGFNNLMERTVAVSYNPDLKMLTVVDVKISVCCCCTAADTSRDTLYQYHLLLYRYNSTVSDRMPHYGYQLDKYVM